MYRTNMGKYSCDDCGKEFTQKSHYDSHKRRKTPCESSVNKIAELEQQIQQLKTKMEYIENHILQIIGKKEEVIQSKPDEPPVTQEVKPVKQVKKITKKKKVVIDQEQPEQKIQKPFLKWVGGKTQILDNVLSKVPKEFNNYHELFLGGGSVLLAVLSLQKQGKIVIKNKIYAYDINETLIHVYKHVQNNKDVLFGHIERYINEYDSLDGTEINRKPASIDKAKTSKESYYYWIRNKYNTIDDKSSVERSALFMIINKLCFRGMYREGPKGYNVPYGHYKTTPTIITREDLDVVSDLIQDVVFECCGFETSIKKSVKGDFVYLDPPYAPENAKSFVGYVADGFSMDAHNNLFDGVKSLKNKKIKFAMSNAKVDFVMDTFKDCQYEDIVARRAINSKDPSATTMEVIVYN
jgi:DNA adenine methylase